MAEEFLERLGWVSVGDESRRMNIFYGISSERSWKSLFINRYYVIKKTPSGRNAWHERVGGPFWTFQAAENHIAIVRVLES